MRRYARAVYTYIAIATVAIYTTFIFSRGIARWNAFATTPSTRSVQCWTAVYTVYIKYFSPQQEKGQRASNPATNAHWKVATSHCSSRVGNIAA